MTTFQPGRLVTTAQLYNEIPPTRYRVIADHGSRVLVETTTTPVRRFEKPRQFLRYTDEPMKTIDTRAMADEVAELRAANERLHRDKDALRARIEELSWELTKARGEAPEYLEEIIDEP